VKGLSEERRVVVRTPVTDKSTLESLKVGDVFYLTGVVVTARDAVHKKVVIEGVKPPIDLRGLAVLHAGPIMVEGKEGWHCVSIGPTTSRRMEHLEYEFVKNTGVKVIIGKGGMGEKTAEACRKFKAVYAIFPGGCGVLGASSVKRVVGVEWLHLGVPEALWILEVENFGPLITSIDVHGNNLADEVIASARSRRDHVVREAIERFRTRAG
jgi:tartrate/fumarate subfamily iron-sulfur-dependent hydro-lyase beta chain